MPTCPECGYYGPEQYQLIGKGEETVYMIVKAEEGRLTVAETHATEAEYVLECRCGHRLPWQGEITFL